MKKCRRVGSDALLALILRCQSSSIDEGLGWRCWYHFGHDTCLVESNLEFITECGAVARGMGCWPSGGIKGGVESA